MKAGVDHELWRRINLVLLDSPDMAVAVSTLIEGLVALLRDAGAVNSDDQARAALAASILSPSDRPVGSLLPLLEAALDRLRPN